MTPEEILQVEKDIVATLKNIYDPEIPVNIYDLADLRNRLRTGRCGEYPHDPHRPQLSDADMLVEDVNQQVAKVKGVKSVNVILTFDPVWDKSMMSEEALLELNML